MSMEPSSLMFDTETAEAKALNPYPSVASKPFTYPLFKRLLDLIGTVIGCILLSPVFLSISLLVKLNDPGGPVFFSQQRIGKDMKSFRIYKFRTMVQDAERKLKENPMLYAKYIKNGYKLDQNEDPRITRIGRFLRKTSLDEFPQLFNVLIGDMSLVGPRPVVKEELREYGERISQFLSVKPGITGYWQVSGRSDVGYPERVDLELHYVYNQSAKFDIFILFKTVQIVLTKKGAY